MINRALSQNADTCLLANEVNRMAGTLDPKLQYDFLYYSVPKKKRFSKWAKAQKNEKINMIIEAYNISVRKAEEIIDLIEQQDFENLESYLSKGGKDSSR
jgi:cellulose synthase/poly-beta-1,6-N-acetylglucosamine synthase-like glycosyltransferase